MDCRYSVAARNWISCQARGLSSAEAPLLAGMRTESRKRGVSHYHEFRGVGQTFGLGQQ